MKVLLINGSPHGNGNTFTALNEIAKTLKEEGVDSEIISIGAKAVQDCATTSREPASWRKIRARLRCNVPGWINHSCKKVPQESFEEAKPF